MKQLILASESPRRKQIMEEMGLDFDIIPSNFEEKHELHSDPIELVKDFAVAKAKDVFNKHPDAIVIGSDTIVCGPEGEILGKPKDKEDARRMMEILQGKKSYVYTAVAVLSSLSTDCDYKTITVGFEPMSEEAITKYLNDPEADWMDKAGAYAIQGKAAEWVSIIDGEYTAIVGLSEELVETLLKKHQA